MVLKALSDWYRVHSRSLPWRKKSPDPYEIWISEVMSQQSVLESVKKYYLSWVEVFPNLASLNRADEADVLKQWAGLGYYSRARLLKKAANQLSQFISEHGDWPKTHQEWQRFSGVGLYTAKAVASIAFGERVIPVDGNVIRVVSRFYGISNPLNTSADRTKVDERVRAFEAELSQFVELNPADVVQAFMDLGATVCRPRTASRCEICPLAELGCKALELKIVEQIPVAKLRPSEEFLDVLADVKVNASGKLWVEPVGEEQPGRLIGQWQVPLIKVDASSHFWNHPIVVRHSITKYRYRVRMPANRSYEEANDNKGPGFWIDPLNHDLHLTTLSQKVISHFFG